MHDSQQHRTGKVSYFSSALISIGLHLAVLVGMFLFARKMQSEDKPEPLKVQLLATAKVNPAPPAPAPPVPAPAPPVPAPAPPVPAPAPPVLAPAPPVLAPAPPVPAPAPPVPAPAPPAPAPTVPPKPPPPKPPLPTPTPLKPPPPKPPPPTPAPPQASSTKPRVPSLEERLRAAKVQGSTAPSSKTPARSESSSNIRSRLLRNVSKSVSTSRSTSSSSGGSSSGGAMTLAEREAVNYADLVVNPRLTPIWNEVGPSRGDLDEVQSSSVEIVFTVLPNGKITLPRISRRSTSAAMNQAAEALLQRIQGLQLPSLAESGIKSTKLSIRITLNAQAAQG